MTVKPCVKIGVDWVRVAQVRNVFEGNPLIQKAVFSDKELSWIEQYKNPFIGLACRFAAKEAFFKAIGTGLTEGTGWCEVEVAQGISGTSALKLEGSTAELAAKFGVIQQIVSWPARTNMLWH